MFFDPSDLSGTKKRVIDPNCIDPNIPKVDNSSVECDQIISTNCVVTSKGYPYLGIGSGETITTVIEKIKEKFKSISFTIQNLGTGLGILKGFSGGVLTAKTIAAGTNIQLTEANDTITINAIGGGSGGGGVINVTHSQLLTFKNTNQLSPGTFYRITDFRTMYDQPDFDSAGVAKTTVSAKLGPVEPLIVVALTTDTLSSKAHQEAYPKDTIEYILEFTTPVNNTVTKGRIIYRKDEWGNETDFDHRNVLFKRYIKPLYNNIPAAYYETSFNSSEFKFITQTNTEISRNNKALGHFSRFLDSSSNLVFDLPNIVLGTDGSGIFNDLSFDTYCFNLTILDGKDSSFSYCSNSFIQVTVNNSKVYNLRDSELFKANALPDGSDSSGIYKSNVSDVINSIIGVNKIYSSTLNCFGSYIGSLQMVFSYSKIEEYGTAPQNVLPTGTLSITESNIMLILYCSGTASFRNVHLATVDSVTFLSNVFSNVRGAEIASLILKPNAIVNDLLILSDISGNMSSATIIYDVALSKEIIKHPGGLYIKHYDQFGAAVINNLNA